MEWQTIIFKDVDYEEDVLPIERSKEIYRDLIDLLKNDLCKSADIISELISKAEEYSAVQLDFDEDSLSPEDLAAITEYWRTIYLFSLITFKVGPEFDTVPYNWGGGTLDYIGCSDEEISRFTEFYTDFEIDKSAVLIEFLCGNVVSLDHGAFFGGKVYRGKIV